jgi:hypothetical protein
MIGKASIVIKQVNDLIDELQNIKNPELEVKKTQINAISDTIIKIERGGVPVPDDLLVIQQKLLSEIREFDDSDEILFFIADELSKSIRKIKGLHSSLEGVSRSHTYKSRDIPVTPKEVLTTVLVEVLKDCGGRANLNDVQNRMATKLKTKFTPADLELLDGGVVRWQKNVQWLRYRLTNEGVLKKNSPHGIWELADDKK